MQKIKFDVGEQRHVRLLIHAADNAPFRIKEAAWELWYAGERIDLSTCGIEDHIIDVFLSAPDRKTSYTLIVTYHINDEVLVEQIEVVVT